MAMVQPQAKPLATVPILAPKMRAPRQPMPAPMPVDAFTPSNAGRAAQSTDAMNKYQ